jgi:hypothetical protein
MVAMIRLTYFLDMDVLLTSFQSAARAESGVPAEYDPVRDLSGWVRQLLGIDLLRVREVNQVFGYYPGSARQPLTFADW